MEEERSRLIVIVIFIIILKLGYCVKYLLLGFLCFVIEVTFSHLNLLTLFLSYVQPHTSIAFAFW